MFMRNFRLKTAYTLIIICFLNFIVASPVNNTGLLITATLLSPNNQATNVQIPVELQWVGTSGNVDIEIVNCTVDPNADLGTIGLDGYELAAGPTIISGIPDDLSGITYNPLTNSLFMVANGNTTVYETDLSGNIERTIFLSGFNDTEGIVHISGTRYAVSEERRGRITFFDITSSTTTVNYANADYAELPASLGPWGANVGLEGVSYDPGTGMIHTVKEKSSKAYYSFEPPVSYPTILSASDVNIPCNMQTDPFGFGDLSDIHHLNLTSGLAELGISTHKLLLSHESLALVETDLNCNEVSRISFNTGGANGTLANAIVQPEGVTMDNNGNLYIVGEPNSLYVFSNPSLNLDPIDIQSTVHTTSTTGTSYTIPSGVLQPSTEYCWRVNDGSGWTDYWSFTTASTIIDICPTIDITNPVNNSVYTNPGTITIQADVDDFEDNITSVDFYADGALLGAGTPAASNGVYEINYTLVNGVHGLSAIVTDGAGCQVTSSFIIITANIPNNSPIINITSPADGLVLGSAAPITIVAGATDNDGAVTQVEYFIDGQSIGIDASSPYTMMHNFIQDGVYEVIATATDDSGDPNTNTASDTIYIQVGINLGPFVDITQPIDGDILTSFQTRTIEANATDPDGFIARVEFFVNGSYIGDDTSAPFEIPYNFNTIGTHNITAIATDNANTTRTSIPVIVTVNITNFSPEVQIISPVTGSTYTPLDLIEIAAEAEDPDGDIQHVEFFVDGVSIDTDEEFPFLTFWQPPGVGSYSITTVATDEDGAQSTVSQSIVNVQYGASITTSSMIDNVNDDVEEQVPEGAADDGDMYFDSSDLECGTDANRGGQIIGLRFNGLNIPQGSMIMNAYIQFMADETQSGATTAVMTGEAADNAAVFSTAKYDLTSRPETGNSVSWNIPAWTNGNSGAAQKTPELKAIIQEIVSRPGYSTASSIVIKMVGTGKRVAESRDGNRPNNAPQLFVTYTLDSCPPEGQLCDDGDPNTVGTRTDGNCGCRVPENGLYVEIPISNGNDDVEERGTDGTVDLLSSDLELVYDRNLTGNQIVGLRFDNSFLPPGAVIDSAFVQFTADETRNTSGTLQIYGEASGESIPFSNTPYDVSSRQKTGASVTWTPDTWNTVGVATSTQRTPNINNIVQEIINRTDWDGLGKPVTIIIEGTGKRVAESYEGSPELAPKLIVYYTSLARTDQNESEITPHESPKEIEPPTYIQQNDIIHGVNIFPNPATDEININMELNDVLTDEGTISVIDINGRIMQQKAFNPMTQQAMEIDVSSLPTGMYLIQIQIDGYSTIRKLMKS